MGLSLEQMQDSWKRGGKSINCIAGKLIDTKTSFKDFARNIIVIRLSRISTGKINHKYYLESLRNNNYTTQRLFSFKKNKIIVKLEGIYRRTLNIVEKVL